MGNVGLGVFVGCGDFEYGGNAETSPSIIHNQMINPANEKDRFYFLELFTEIPRYIPLCSLNQ